MAARQGAPPPIARLIDFRLAAPGSIIS